MPGRPQKKGRLVGHVHVSPLVNVNQNPLVRFQRAFILGIHTYHVCIRTAVLQLL